MASSSTNTQESGVEEIPFQRGLSKTMMAKGWGEFAKETPQSKKFAEIAKVAEWLDRFAEEEEEKYVLLLEYLTAENVKETRHYRKAMQAKAKDREMHGEVQNDEWYLGPGREYYIHDETFFDRWQNLAYTRNVGIFIQAMAWLWRRGEEREVRRMACFAIHGLSLYDLWIDPSRHVDEGNKHPTSKFEAWQIFYKVKDLDWSSLWPHAGAQHSCSWLDQRDSVEERASFLIYQRQKSSRKSANF